MAPLLLNEPSRYDMKTKPKGLKRWPYRNWSSLAPRLITLCASALIFIAGAGASRGQSPSVREEKLDVSLAEEVVTLSEDLLAIDSSVCDSFKAEVWTELAAILSERARAGLSLQELIKNDFESVTKASRFAAAYQAFEKALANPRLENGKKVVDLQERTVELLMTLGQIADGLEVALTEVTATNGAGWLKTVTDEQMREVVEDGIRRHYAHAQRLAKLEVLTKTSPALLQFLGVDPAKYRSWLAAYRPKIPENGTPDEVKRATAKTARLSVHEEQIKAELVRIKNALSTRRLDAREQVATLQRSLTRPEVQVPLGDGVFLVYRLESPDQNGGARPTGEVRRSGGGPEQKWPAADLLLRVSAGTTTAFYGGGGTDAKAPPAQVAATSYDFPLGIRIAEVAINENRLPQIIVRPYNTIGFVKGKLDDLSRSLAALGLPQGVQLLGAEVITEGIRTDFFGLKLKLKLPVFDQAHDFTFFVKPGKFPVEPEFFLKTIARAEVLNLEQQFMNELRTKLRELPGVGGPAIRLQNVIVAGSWVDRTLAVSADIGSEAAGVSWRVPLGFREEGGKFVFGITDPAVPSKVVDQLRSSLLSWLRANVNLGEAFDVVERYATVNEVTYDREHHSLRGTLRIKSDLLGTSVPSEFTSIFTCGLGGKLDIQLNQALPDIKKQLGALGEAMLKAAKEAAITRVNEELRKRLATAHFDFVGLEARVTKVTPQGQNIDLTCQVKAGNREFEIDRLRLVSADVGEDGGIKAPKFDFSNCEINPSLEVMLAEVIELKPDWLGVSQIRKTPAGISFMAELRPAGLDFQIPLGEVIFGTSGVQWKKDLLAPALTAAALQAFGERNVNIGEVGAVKKVKLDPRTTGLGNPLRIGFTGELALANIIDVPVAITVLPKLCVQSPSVAQILGSLTGPLVKLFPADLAVKPYGIRFLDHKPYGVEFSVKTTLGDLCAIDLKNLKVTQNGAELPPTITIQIGTPIYVGPYIVAVNPGITIPLKGKGGVGVLGDLTLFSPGIEHILKIAASLNQVGKLKDQHYTLDGKIVIFDMVPLFKVRGEAEFSRGKINNEARTIGIIDKIVQVRDQQHIDGQRGFLNQKGNMGLFGLPLLNTDVGIQVGKKDVHISAKAKTKTPLAAVSLTVAGSLPSMRDAVGTGNVEAKVGGYQISGADLELRWSRAQLKFGLLGFDLTIIAPSANAIDPGVVLKAIMEIFKFNLSFSLQSLIDREIVLNLIDSNGGKTDGSVGEGSPPPPGAPQPDDTRESSDKKDGAKENEDRSFPPGAPGEEESPPAGDESKPPGAEEHRQPTEAQMTKMGMKPVAGKGSQVTTYRAGTAIYEFTEIRGAAGHYFMHEKGHDTIGWVLSPEVFKLLRESNNSILAFIHIRDTSVGEVWRDNVPLPTRREYFLTYRVGTDELSVGAAGYNGKVTKLVAKDGPIPEIEKAYGGAKFHELLNPALKAGTNASKPKALGDAELDLLGKWARTVAEQRPQDFEKVAYADLVAWLKAEGFPMEIANGYFYLGAGDFSEGAYLRLRDSNVRVDVPKTNWFYRPFEDRGQDDHLRHILTLDIAAHLLGDTLDPVYGTKDYSNVMLLAEYRSRAEAPKELIRLAKGAKTLRIALHWQGDARSLAALFANGEAPTAFFNAVTAVMSGESMDEMWVAVVDDHPRAVFTSRLGEKDWKVLAIYFDGKANRFEPVDWRKGIASGEAVETYYRDYDIRREQAEKDLGTRKAREWFIKRALEPATKWNETLRLNPLPLLIP